MQLTTLYMSLYYKSSVVSYTIFVADQSLTIYVVLRALGETLPCNGMLFSLKPSSV